VCATGRCFGKVSLVTIIEQCEQQVYLFSLNYALLLKVILLLHVQLVFCPAVIAEIGARHKQVANFGSAI